MRILNTFPPKSNTNKLFLASGLTKQCVNAWKPPVAGEDRVIWPERAKQYREAADALIAGAISRGCINPHREVTANPWLPKAEPSEAVNDEEMPVRQLTETEKQKLYPFIPFTCLLTALVLMCRRAYECKAYAGWQVSAGGVTAAFPSQPEIRFSAYAVKLFLAALIEFNRKNDHRHHKLNPDGLNIRISLREFCLACGMLPTKNNLHHLRQYVNQAIRLLRDGSLSWQEKQRRRLKSFNGLHILRDGIIRGGYINLYLTSEIGQYLIYRTVTRVPASIADTDNEPNLFQIGNKGNDDFNLLVIYSQRYYIRQQTGTARDRLAVKNVKDILRIRQDSRRAAQSDTILEGKLNHLVETGQIAGWKVCAPARAPANFDVSLSNPDAMIVLLLKDAPLPPKPTRHKPKQATAAKAATVTEQTRYQEPQVAIPPSAGVVIPPSAPQPFVPAASAVPQDSAVIVPPQQEAGVAIPPARPQAVPQAVSANPQQEPQVAIPPSSGVAVPPSAPQAVMAEKHVSEIPSPRDFVMKETFEPGEADYIADCLRQYEKNPSFCLCRENLFITFCGLQSKGYRPATIRDWLYHAGLTHCAEAADREIKAIAAFPDYDVFADIPEPQVPLPSLTAA